jgi:hypothetical protein
MDKRALFAVSGALLFTGAAGAAEIVGTVKWVGPEARTLQIDAADCTFCTYALPAGVDIGTLTPGKKVTITYEPGATAGVRTVTKVTVG